MKVNVMKNSIRRIIAVLMIIVMTFSMTSCDKAPTVITINGHTVIEKAEIIGDLKGEVAVEGTFIEIKFDKETTFDTVVLEEVGNQIEKFSIWLTDNDGEDYSIYEQDRIGEYRYCEIGEHTAQSLKICINASNESQYELKKIDVLNVQDNKNEDFRVTSYIVCPTYYANGTVDTEKIQSITDVILFGIARFNEKGEIYLQDSDINGQLVSGDEIFKKIITDLRTANPDIKIHCNALGPDGIDAADKEKLHSQAFKKNDDKLITNILNLLETYDFDGFFFDYEYPYEKKSIRHYSNFLVKLDEAMDNYILGAALANWNCNLSKNAIEALDRVEIMSYDDTWSFPNAHAEFASVGGALAVKSFIENGYDLSKCDLGLPFYGRTHNGEEAWPSYEQIAADLDNNPFKNRIAKSYLTGDTSGEITTSFNSVQMIRDKTAFANDYGLGGVMVWHYSCDVPYESDLSLFKAIQTSLNSRN